MRSMFSGISGLKVHQTKMDVIANNISNVNTVGFKSSRVTFNEFFSQNISPATSPNEDTGRGGVNAKQIGLGASLGSIDLNMTTGTTQRTDRPFDLSINGDGFFIVGDKGRNFFTRAGALVLDKAGNIVINTGEKLKGWIMEEDPKNPGAYIPLKDKVQPIEIKGDKTYAPPMATKHMKMSGNLNTVDNKEHISTIAFYDSLGNRYVVDSKLSYDDTNKTWAYQLGDIAYLNGDKDKAYQINHGAPDFQIDSLVTPTPDVINYTSYGDVKFTSDGLIDENELTMLDMNITNTGLPFDSTFGTAGVVNMDLTGLTAFNQIADAYATTINGNTSGNLTNMSISQDGTLIGQYSNGEIRPLYKVPVATFINPAGLEKVGNNLFRASLNSGDFDEIGRDVGALGGSILSGALEMSNVDLSGEFTEMITTQRGFQANSRTITTSDEMLQELVNLKR